MPEKSFRLSYIPSFDGLRGIAVLGVMMQHALIPFLQGAAIGVDVFFVLSGFLITSLLVKEYDMFGRINFRNFYMRRFLRLFPALIFLLIILNIFAHVILKGDKADATLRDSVVTLSYLSNWFYAFEIVPPLYLGHTWSLAVEEQFYIIFPALLILLIRFFSRKNVVLIIAGMAVLSWVWRIVLTANGVIAGRIYFGTDTRLDGILMGCALSLVLSTVNFAALRSSFEISKRLMSVLALIACVILLSICTFDMTIPHNKPLYYYVLFFVVALLAGFLILYLVAIEDSALKRFLEWAPLVFVGKLSYALYLWNLIFYKALVNTLALPIIWVAVFGTLLSFVSSLISYNLIEQPILRFKTRFQMKS